MTEQLLEVPMHDHKIVKHKNLPLLYQQGALNYKKVHKKGLLPMQISEHFQLVFPQVVQQQQQLQLQTRYSCMCYKKKLLSARN
jgi:hypothetical protein